MALLHDLVYYVAGVLVIFSVESLNVWVEHCVEYVLLFVGHVIWWLAGVLVVVGCLGLWGSFSRGGLGRGLIGGPIGMLPIRL